MTHRKGYPRLTHILSETDPPHVKQKLANWQRKNKTTYYADLGTVVHEWANFAALAAGTDAFEDFVSPLWECKDIDQLWERGYPWECRHPSKGYPMRIWEFDQKFQHSWFLKAQSLIPILRTIETVLWSEGAVEVEGDFQDDALYYDDGKVRFTTRPDLVVKFKDRPEPYLVEIKTSKGFYSTEPMDGWKIKDGNVLDDKGNVAPMQRWKFTSLEIGWEKYQKTATQLYAQSLALGKCTGLSIPYSQHLIWVVTNQPKNVATNSCQILRVKHDRAKDWAERVNRYFSQAV